MTARTDQPCPTIRIKPADAHTLGYRDMRLTLGQVQALRALAIKVADPADTTDVEYLVRDAVAAVLRGRLVTVNAAAGIVCIRNAEMVEQHIATLVVQQPEPVAA